jgi:pyruvate formate lyase activating enzyme
MKPLAASLAERVREAGLSLPLDRNRVRCLACGLRCPVSPGFAGVCKVRFNRGGRLFAPFGYINAAWCDPIEKKPFFHAWPGSSAYSFGMLGCDLHCSYCQNWVSSQALRDFRSVPSFRPVTPETLIAEAIGGGATAIVSTYNEPLITAEWAVAVFRQARAAGLATGFVSNGNATPEALEYLHPWVDLYKVDLKTFSDRRYHELGGRLAPILDSIRRIHAMGFWLEIVTLVVPGFNDSAEELRDIASFIAAISPDIPWHVTAFHPDYRMTGPDATPPATLIRAATIGREAGLHYVYAGNLPGAVAAGEASLENTYCPGCGATLVERRGFRVLRNRIAGTGRCPACATPIPGRWAAAPPAARDPGHLLHSRCG